jgi:hypothetical protein
MLKKLLGLIEQIFAIESKDLISGVTTLESKFIEVLNSIKLLSQKEQIRILVSVYIDVYTKDHARNNFGISGCHPRERGDPGQTKCTSYFVHDPKGNPPKKYWKNINELEAHFLNLIQQQKLECSKDAGEKITHAMHNVLQLETPEELSAMQIKYATNHLEHVRRIEGYLKTLEEVLGAKLGKSGSQLQGVDFNVQGNDSPEIKALKGEIKNIRDKLKEGITNTKLTLENNQSLTGVAGVLDNAIAEANKKKKEVDVAITGLDNSIAKINDAKIKAQNNGSLINTGLNQQIQTLEKQRAALETFKSNLESSSKALEDAKASLSTPVISSDTLATAYAKLKELKEKMLAPEMSAALQAATNAAADATEAAKKEIENQAKIAAVPTAYKILAESSNVASGEIKGKSSNDLKDKGVVSDEAFKVDGGDDIDRAIAGLKTLLAKTKINMEAMKLAFGKINISDANINLGSLCGNGFTNSVDCDIAVQLLEKLKGDLITTIAPIRTSSIAKEIVEEFQKLSKEGTAAQLETMATTFDNNHLMHVINILKYTSEGDKLREIMFAEMEKRLPFELKVIRNIDLLRQKFMELIQARMTKEKIQKINRNGENSGYS